MKMKNNKINNKHFLYKFILIVIFNIINFLLFQLNVKIKSCKKIGVVGVLHDVNIGNNLIKYAISIKLKELGYIPYIIGTNKNNFNITFINETTNLVIIRNNFSEIKEDDYDALMVNSDQTWRKFDNTFYDYGFLKFSENWKIKKFVYGASLGFDDWKLSSEDEFIAKKLLKDFTGVSVREKGAINLIKQHLGLTPIFVADPTFLIDKKYYLDIIKDYKGKIVLKNKYIFIYCLPCTKYIFEAAKTAKNFLNYDTYYFQLTNLSSIQNFIYYMLNSEVVITNAFHGTVFSIIFNKPFITIFNKSLGKERYNTLDYLFGINDRIFAIGQKINFSLLLKPLKIDLKLLNQLKIKSINFIKNNLKK